MNKYISSSSFEPDIVLKEGGRAENKTPIFLFKESTT